MGLTEFGKKHHISCKCGHSVSDHRDEGVGPCTSDTTMHMVKSSTNKPCGCRAYRPSLFDLMMDLIP